MTKEEFLKDCANWDNHRQLLWPALEITTGDVIEMGMGNGSTPYLHEYCEYSQRRLYSFDNSREWVDKFTHLANKDHLVQWMTSWDAVSELYPKCDVLLIDHAPGERRHIDIQKYANKAKIIIIHDSEPAATGYLLDRIWGLFKYRVDFKSEGAWASAVSNFYDVTNLLT